MAKSTFTGLTLTSTLPLRPFGILKSTHLYQEHNPSMNLAVAPHRSTAAGYGLR